ncbi:hypothetical protein RRSWK_02868 [Rhodopirellula sp. SWK7]|nr:hypothetical protein RRSWK_02868 [Rhodopirellula sp. SWK7]
MLIPKTNLPGGQLWACSGHGIGKESDEADNNLENLIARQPETASDIGVTSRCVAVAR